MAKPTKPPQPGPQPARKPRSAPTRPLAPATDSAPDGQRTGALSFFRTQLAQARARTGPGACLVSYDDQRAVIGPQLKHLCQQYLFNNDCLPLGRMLMLVGSTDSCKSALTFELMRWLAEYEGISYYQLTEARDMPDLRLSIMRHLEPFCQPILVQHTEDWMVNMTTVLKDLAGLYQPKSSGPGAVGLVEFPLQFVVDSIAGATGKAVVAQIERDGAPSQRISVNASLINDYTKYIFSRLVSWPILLTTTNHIKYRTNKSGMPPTPVYPGGDALRYHSTFLVEMRRLKDLDDLKRVDGGRRLRLQTRKNSLGQRSKIIEVEMVWRFHMVNGEPKQVTWFDWGTADIELLCGRRHHEQKELDKVLQFTAVNKVMRTASCKALDCPKPVSWSTLSAKLQSKPAVLRALQDVFHIHRRCPFRLGVPFNEQVEAAIAAGHVESILPGGEGDSSVPDDDLATEEPSGEWSPEEELSQAFPIPLEELPEDAYEEDLP